MKPTHVGLAILCVALMGCKNRTDIIGKWQDPSNETLEFLDGGDFVFQSPQLNANGRWRKLGDDRIAASFKGPMAVGGTMICSYKLDGGDLVLAGCPLAGGGRWSPVS